MSDQNPPGGDKKTSAIPMGRIVVWLLVGGFGLYLVITGVMGIIIKGL